MDPHVECWVLATDLPCAPSILHRSHLDFFVLFWRHRCCHILDLHLIEAPTSWKALSFRPSTWANPCSRHASSKPLPLSFWGTHVCTHPEIPDIIITIGGCSPPSQTFPDAAPGGQMRGRKREEESEREIMWHSEKCHIGNWMLTLEMILILSTNWLIKPVIGPSPSHRGTDGWGLLENWPKD